MIAAVKTSAQQPRARRRQRLSQLGVDLHQFGARSAFGGADRNLDGGAVAPPGGNSSAARSAGESFVLSRRALKTSA